MKITIITTTYNSGSTVRDTIESVLSQDYPDIEYIIIDGASSDNTLQIVNEYADRISLVISEPDRGIYDAMNKGIRMATGDVVGILNSDDVYADEHVLTDIASSFPDDETEAVFANLVFVKASDMTSVVRTWIGKPYYPGAFRSGWHPAHPTFYVRRSVYRRFGLFDLSLEVSADFELMLRLIEKYRIRTRFLDRTVVKMRMGGESTGSLRKIIRGNRNVIQAFRKNGIPVSPFYLLFRIYPKVLNILKTKIKRL